MCRQSAMNLGPRRKSVDVGGLALALGETGSGSGWMGGEENDGDGAPPCVYHSPVVRRAVC